MSTTITAYTSIPSNISRSVQGEDIGRTYQDACIDSWRKAGLRVVSLNCEREIHDLQKRGMDVEFVSNGSQWDRTKIACVLSSVAKAGDRVAAIINADCLLIHYGEFISTVSRSAQDSIVLFERLNVDPDTFRPAGSHCYGFDAFFFDTRFIGNLASTDSWLIGEPFWDYWFPLSMIYAGARLKMPRAPSLVHLNHDTGWRPGTWGANVTALRATVSSWDNVETIFPEEFVTCVRARQKKSQFGNFLFSWLRSTAEPINLSAEGTEGALIYRLLAGLSESEERQLLNELRHLGRARWTLSKMRAFKSALARLQKSPSGPQDELLEQIS